jgi:hypothetical protein
LTGVSRKRAISAKATISSNLDRISARRMPRIAPFRKMFSRPVSSGWKPVPTSRRLPTRPWISANPRDGSVMRESTFSRVLLPAPFLPMIPTTSPRRISKETPSRAQIVLSGRRAFDAASRRSGAAAAADSVSRSVRYPSRRAPRR